MTADRIYAFDRLRVLATVGVVLLHGGAGILGARLGTEPGFFTQVNASNIYDSAGRFAVNCFFMISAALLLAPERHFTVVRQTRKVLIPLIVWSVVYIVADALLVRSDRIAVNGSVGEPNLLAPVQLVRDALAGPVAYHLWFVYVLVALYLVTPLLRPITARPPEERRRLLLYAVGLWLVTDVLLRSLRHWWDGAPALYGPALLVLPVGSLGVFLLGFLLFHHPPRVSSWVPAAMAAVGFAWMVLDVWLQQSTAEPHLWAYGNHNPPVLLFSCGVFLLITRPATRTKPSPRWVGVFSGLSYRIYLIHALVMHLLRREGPTGRLYQDNPTVGILVVVILTVAISFAIAWLLERVRPLRNIW